MEECKNRFPCGWCDRKNGYCDVIRNNSDGLTCCEEVDGYGRISKIFDSKPNCLHKWNWQRSTSKGDVLYICEDCGAIKKMYPKKYKLT